MINYIIQNPFEAAGIVSTLICVWLNIKENIWGWFWAIISSGIYAWVYYNAKLYSDMELQFVFIIISFYGWWHWLYHNGTGPQLPVTNTPAKLYVPLLLILVAAAFASGFLHQYYTDASLPYLDSALTATSLVAQWLMARKYIENWLLWIAANVVYVYMYMSKGLTGTAILYVFLFFMAIKGSIDWRKSMHTSLVSK